MTSLVLASPEKFTNGFRRSFSVTEKKKEHSFEMNEKEGRDLEGRGEELERPLSLWGWKTIPS
eukprot:scaffold17809_cov76-Amphora_coffeaeformis.AAC.1